VHAYFKGSGLFAFFASEFNVCLNLKNSFHIFGKLNIARCKPLFNRAAGNGLSIASKVTQTHRPLNASILARKLTH